MNSGGKILPSKEAVKEVNLLLFHKDCADGVAAAWPFIRERNYPEGIFIKTPKSKDLPRDKLIVEGWVHGGYVPGVDKIPEHFKNKTIVIVDYCFPRECILDMAKITKKILILDHHDKAEKDLQSPLPDNVYTIFDKTRSAAQISWDYVYGERYVRPWFVDIIAARDLWKYPNKEAEILSSYLYHNGYYNWEKLEELLDLSDTDEKTENIMKEFVKKFDPQKGKVAFLEKDIIKACKESVLTIFTTPSGKKYKVRLTTGPPKIRSDIGNRVSAMKDCEFSVFYAYDYLVNEFWCSARASSSFKGNLSDIASEFERGGGHEKAAGFAITGGKTLHDYFTILKVPECREGDRKFIKTPIATEPPKSSKGDLKWWE